MHNNAPDIKNYSYDFGTQRFINNATGLEFRPSSAAFDDALGRGQRGAAGVGKDSGRAAILIQSLVSEKGRGIGDGGILQAILDESRSLVKDRRTSFVFPLVSVLAALVTLVVTLADRNAEVAQTANG